MAACVRELFGTKDEEEWRHAFSSSILTAKLIEGSESTVNSRLILIMLLHDIGKNMLGIYNRRKYFKARMMAETEQLCAHKAELLVFRVNHAEAGGLLLKRWMLPQSVIRPVFFHHVTAVPTDYKLEVAMTQFVDWIDCMARNDVCMPPCDGLMKAARLESVDVNSMVNYQRNLIESIPGDSLIKRKLPVIRETELEKEDFDVPEEYMEENSDSTQIIRRSRFRA
jgi:HD-like signal output (HDOD) protein